jgi:hypothetical protein
MRQSVSRRRLTVRCLTICAGLACASCAHAYDRERAKAQLAGELSECAAYFIVVSEFADHHGRPQVADNVAMTAEVLMDGSVALVGEAATQAGYEGARRNHLAVLRDAESFTRVVDRYNEPCRALFRDPGRRMQFWLDQR